MASKEKSNSPNQLINLLKRPINKFRNLSRKGKIVSLVLLGLLVFWRINVARNSGIEVEVSRAAFGTLTESVNASGEIFADKAANLMFLTSGEVKEVNFKEGDQVKKGDVIAKLDTTTLYSNYQIAEATLRAAQANLDSVYDTLQGRENDESYAQISTRTTAETTKDKAYWTFASASKSLEGAFIVAPFDGVVTQVPVDVFPGATAYLPTSAIFQIVDPATTYFRAQVSEADINKLTSGAGAKIEIDAFPDQSFDGKVTGFNISSVTTSTGGTAYIVRVSLPENENSKFKLGMNGDVDIVISQTDHVLLVPITSVVEESSSSYVWIVDNNKAKKAEVETGKSSVDQIEITSGINEGTVVVTRPPSKIEEGKKLKVGS
jgi:HlyD family secretion protein